MKFDLTMIDFTKDVTNQLKEQHYNIVNEMINNGERETDDNSKVTVFHGTSLYFLNSILLNGLVPSSVSSRSTFEGELKSHEGLVYLSNKWHYWYAGHSYNKLCSEKGEDAPMNVPCYVECVLPKSSLVLDEDFFHSKYVFNKVKNTLRRRQTIMELTPEECLSQYATIAHFGEVKREEIVSFTILANKLLFTKNFIDPKCQYQKDLNKWSSGKGKGQLKFMDLICLEDDKYNLTFQMNKIPKDHIITEAFFDNGKDQYSLKFNKVVFTSDKETKNEI